MVNRIQNRNSGYSDGLFSKRTIIPNNSYNNSISGAAALKLDEQFEVGAEQQSPLNIQQETVVQNQDRVLNSPALNEDDYLESNNKVTNEESLFEVESIEQVPSNDDSVLSSEEEYTPKLFSEENSSNNNSSIEEEQKIFDQKNNQEDDFEIPAFLRRQKF